jgi:hypothetical protein
MKNQGFQLKALARNKGDDPSARSKNSKIVKL